MQRTILLGTLMTLFCVPGTTAQKSVSQITSAPLPSKILVAKTAFILNGGGSDPSVPNVGGSSPAYDILYSNMKAWERFRLVDSVEQADIILEVSYKWEYVGWHIITKQGEKIDVERTIGLTIYDAKNHQRLWTIDQHPRFAYREKNREKEFINACNQLTTNFERLVGGDKQEM